VLAVLVDLLLRRRWVMALISGSVTVLVVAPWIGWMAMVGLEPGTQARFLVQGGTGLRGRVVSQASFYIKRIPDQITGPLVEVATVMQRSPRLALAARLWSVFATSIVLLGWVIALRRPHLRLAGLIPLLTLAILLVWPYTEAGRFLIPLLPCILIGALEGLTWLGSAAVRARGRRVSRRRIAFSAAVLILIVSLPYPLYLALTGRERARDGEHRTFDGACAWIRENAVKQGPILSRHPGEVFLATGRQGLEVSTSERPGDLDAGAETIARKVDQYHVAYLLIDQERYRGAPTSPLTSFVAEHPERVLKVWSQGDGASSVAIYEVLPPQ
jgi:hypothetical protein